MPLHVIGASGRSGLALCRALAAECAGYVPVVRNRAKWDAAGLDAVAATADLREPASLSVALQHATTVVSCAHARHAAAIIAAAPACERFVFLGSTRKYTRWPDAHAEGVLAGEAAFMRSGRPGVMLHPTMIYGSQGEDNVQRLARLLRRLPVVPLPGGGGALVRPIHQSDVTRALQAAIARAWDEPAALVIAGADSLAYADFIRAVALAAGLPPPRLAAIPLWLLRAAAPLTRVVPGVPVVRMAELRRLMEDKSFGIEAMVSQLGVTPCGLAEGLRLTFRAAC